MRMTIANSETAKQLKELFTALLGTRVTVKKGTGSMKFTYYINLYNNTELRPWTIAEAELIRLQLSLLGAYRSCGSLVTVDQDIILFRNQISFGVPSRG